LSIFYMALENVVGASLRRRWIIAGLFGLVHGFGFAAALSELELSGAAMVRALIGFNLGVELGQLVFIALFFPPLLWLVRGQRWVIAPSAVSVVVAIVGAYWFIDRLLQA